jgi:RND family efflux transporter MFP subunit
MPIVEATKPVVSRGKASPVVRTAVLAVALIAGLGFLLLALAGFFKPKVPAPGQLPSQANADGRPLAKVRLVRRPVHETAVGTVRAVHEAAVASKLLARVIEVRVKAGQVVTQDEVLVRLDDSALQARLKQVEAAVVTATASKEGATADWKRAEELLPSGGISKEDADRRATALRTATAELERARQTAREAKVLLDYATIRSPLTGRVIDKRVEAGDTVIPGQVLLTLYDPTRMQMIVTVRESLARQLSVGQKVRGRLEALNHDCEATVSEIVPEAQAASRSFAVKVTGPCPPGVYSGMFGRIFIPLGQEEVVTVPAAAVVRVGQLDIVAVVEDGNVRRRSVQLGRPLNNDYEVLAGLRPGETVVLQRVAADFKSASTPDARRSVHE